MSGGPLIVQSDKTVLLEIDHDQANDARQALAAELMATVDRQLGAVARPAQVHIVSMLPKTRSGKIMRRLLKDLAEGREAGDATTLDRSGSPVIVTAVSGPSGLS